MGFTTTRFEMHYTRFEIHYRKSHLPCHFTHRARAMMPVSGLVDWVGTTVHQPLERDNVVRYPLWPTDCSTLSATPDGVCMSRDGVLPVLCGPQQESWGECLERNTACCEGNNHLTRPRTASKQRANPKCKFVFLYFKFHIFNVSDNLVSE